MAIPPTSLLAYLTLPNPRFRVHGSDLSTTLRTTSRPSSSKSGQAAGGGAGFPSVSSRFEAKWPRPRALTPWTDFNLDSIVRISNGALFDQLCQARTNPPQLHDYNSISEFFLYLYTENALDAALIKSTQSIVLEALEKVCPTMGLRRIGMVRGGQAVLAYAQDAKDCPDWAGVVMGEWAQSTYRPQNVLPGETKTSWSVDVPTMIATFNPAVNLRSGDRGSPQVPLCQVLYYCLMSMSRYGYLITDTHLLVMRVRPMALSTFDPVQQPDNFLVHMQDNCAVEYAIIERHHEIGHLSVNLALWFLHILAASDGRLQNVPSYPPLRDQQIGLECIGLPVSKAWSLAPDGLTLSFDEKNRSYSELDVTKDVDMEGSSDDSAQAGPSGTHSSAILRNTSASADDFRGTRSANPDRHAKRKRPYERD